MYGHRPTLISGAPKRARSDATTRSQARASPKPPASAKPWHARHGGLAQSPQRAEDLGQDAARLVHRQEPGLGLVRSGHLPEVGPGTEGLVARSRQDDHADLGRPRPPRPAPVAGPA